jgi:nitroreductase / dihydropteridine reductase
MNSLHEALAWRYATKKFDPRRIVSDDKIDRIIEAARLAATSSGLQPFELFVVTNPDVRRQIRSVAWDQAQIIDCSHLLVFAAWDDITPERVNIMFDLTNDVRGFTNEGFETYRQQLLGIVTSRDQEANYQAAARQAYIALGTALIAAAFEQVDATPMEGFDPAAVDEILGLGERKLRSVILMPIGYRDADGDWLVNLQKVRRAREHFVTEVK